MSPQRGYVAGTVALILSGILVGWVLTLVIKPVSFVPKPGVSAFAVFYIAAQALERLAELLKLIFPQVGATTVEGEKKNKVTAVTERNSALADALNLLRQDSSPDTDNGDVAGHAVPDAAGTSSARLMVAAQSVADKQRNVSQIRGNTTVFVWGLNSFLASVLCGWLGLYLLDAVGFQAIPRLLDIAVTGLAIGGGTKPLHDLISNIEKAKESKQDPPETGGGVS